MRQTFSREQDRALRTTTDTCADCGGESRPGDPLVTVGQSRVHRSHTAGQAMAS